jgi:hypothetical protein
VNGVSIELYRTGLDDGLTAEDGSMGPYLVRYPKTLRTMAPVLAAMKLRRISRSILVPIDTDVARRRTGRVVACCLTGIVAFGVAVAGYHWQAANQKLAARNKRLEALVEVMRERKTNGSNSQVRPVTQP